METLIVMALFTLNFVHAHAQEKMPEKEKEINVDLPDETEETNLLEKGQLQGEFAYLYTDFDKGIQPALA